MDPDSQRVDLDAQPARELLSMIDLGPALAGVVFEHERAVLRQGPVAMIKLIYPPYTPRVKRVIKWMFKLFT